MFHSRALGIVVWASVLTLTVSMAHADVFKMPSGQTSLQFVTVGDAGNVADTATGSLYGAVGYVYQMGTYDVTVAQYCQFLNAVAATSDPYGLYTTGNQGMGSRYATIGIAQSGSSGNYSYAVAGSDSQAANCPIFDISWGDAARFSNWLQNGQPSYPAGTPGEVAGSTETGAYTLNGAVTDAALITVTRNTGATYFIPSENEWYKAAYYKGGGANAGYWTYPTQSNTVPGNTLPDVGNGVNYSINYTYNCSDPANLLTPVGAFSASPGPYGTFDMGGDVWQWDETPFNSSTHGLRGGGWGDTDPATLSVSDRCGDWYSPSVGLDGIGFRVARLPSLPGDANGDGTVNIADLSILLANFDKTGMTWSQGDFNGDGTVNISDLSQLLANFDKTAGASAGITAVPEPSSIMLLVAGAASLLAWRRRSSKR